MKAPKTRIELTETRPTPLEVLIGAFGHLLETGRPGGPDDIAKHIGSLDVPVVEERLRGLEQRIPIRRNDAGEVMVAGGLSVQPTVHRMKFDGRLRFTCCAFDALGILGALRADGSIESTSPTSGASVTIIFWAGVPETSDAVLFYADDSCCNSVLDEWCPNVNFFEGKEQAARWAERSGVVGTVLSLGEATERATREWAPLVSPETQGR